MSTDFDKIRFGLFTWLYSRQSILLCEAEKPKKSVPEQQ